MASPMLHDLQAEIDEVKGKVDKVEEEEDEVKSALKGRGSYLGTTDRVSPQSMTNTAIHYGTLPATAPTCYLLEISQHYILRGIQ